MCVYMYSIENKTLCLWLNNSTLARAPSSAQFTAGFLKIHTPFMAMSAAMCFLLFIFFSNLTE